MKSSERRLLFVGICFIAVVASVLLYTPAPSSVDQPVQFTVFMAFVKLHYIGHYFWQLFGLDPMMVTYHTVREMTRTTAPYLHHSVQADDTVYDGVPVRVYQHRSGDAGSMKRPAMIFVHGGGFHYGTPYGYEVYSEMMVRNLDMVVVSVDYRSSLMHPSPAALEDTRTVAYYVYNNAEKLGIDPDKIGVAGDSAGGALSAALSLWLRDHNEHPKLAYQVFFYPWLQALDFHLPSHWLNRGYDTVANVDALAVATLLYLNTTNDHHPKLIANNHISSAALKRYQTLVNRDLIPQHLVPDDYAFQTQTGPSYPIDAKFEEAILDPYNFPLMATDLTGLPPTYILAEEHDTLRDDSIIFAERLRMSGNDIVLNHDNRGWHAMICFLHQPLKVTVAEEVVYETIDFIKNRL